jgi:hypothetical protein
MKILGALLVASSLIVSSRTAVVGEAMTSQARSKPTLAPQPTATELKDLGAQYIVDHGQVHPELSPGDLFIPIPEVGGIEVPAAGGTGWSIPTLAPGIVPIVGDVIGIHTQPDGSVYVYLPIPSLGRHSSTPNSVMGYDECDTRNVIYTLSFYMDHYGWWFNAASTPPELIVDNARQAVQNGAQNVTQESNNCGRSDNFPGTQSYKGDTSQAANINSDGTCKQQDDIGVVGFGTLPALVLGKACPWQTIPGSDPTSDMRLNKASYQWVVNIGPNCQAESKYSVEAAATHERGHIFGLADQYNSLYDQQTMWGYDAPCDDHKKSLGWGDMNALESTVP